MPPRTEPPSLRRRLRSAALGDLERFLSGLVGRFDRPGAQQLGRVLGAAAWPLARRDRRRTLEHLAIAFPDLDAVGRERIGRQCFRHFGCVLAECLWLRDRGPGEVRALVDLEGWERIEATRATGRPALILTGHCGNWELLAAALNVRGLGMAVVAREIDEPELQASLLDLRARFGTRTIVRGRPGAARELLRTLRSGGALGMLIDQDTRVEGVFVEFFGRPAWTPVGAAEIAQKLGAAVHPTFIERCPDGRHRARIEPALGLPADPVAATQAMTDRIEQQIRRVPEQWVWMHRRWRRRPEDVSRPQPPG